MNGRKIWCALMALGLGLAAASASSDVHADQKKKDKTTAPAVATDPPVAKKTIAFDLTGVSFGQSTKKVSEAIEKILDEDYKPLYAKVSPGVKMKALDSALAEEKSAFGRSVIKFDKIPVALDSGPFKGEYTYNNKEQKLDFTRKGVTYHFFFIQDKLWKLYVEHKLGEKEPKGKDFTDAVTKVAKDLGIAGRVLAADLNRMMQEVDWKDATTHLRLVDRGSDKIAFVYEDSATLGNINTLRANKPAVVNEIDPAVAAITRKDADPGPPPKADERKGTTPPKKK